MPSSYVMLFASLCVWFTMVAPDMAAELGAWKAGVAKAAITPAEPVWMAGYASRNGPSDGVLVDLYCRALVLLDAQQNRLVVVTLDLIEIPDSLRELITDVARKNHGLQPHELLLNVSHTHGGPMVSAKTIADWGNLLGLGPSRGGVRRGTGEQSRRAPWEGAVKPRASDGWL